MIAEIKAAIQKRIDDDPDLRAQRDLLDSVPGLGDKSIGVLLSFYGGRLRFASARQAAAFAGLDPRRHESCSSVKHKPRVSKLGRALLRKALYMPAMVKLTRTAWGPPSAIGSPPQANSRWSSSAP